MISLSLKESFLGFSFERKIITNAVLLYYSDKLLCFSLLVLLFLGLLFYFYNANIAISNSYCRVGDKFIEYSSIIILNALNINKLII